MGTKCFNGEACADLRQSVHRQKLIYALAE